MSSLLHLLYMYQKYRDLSLATLRDYKSPSDYINHELYFDAKYVCVHKMYVGIN